MMLNAEEEGQIASAAKRIMSVRAIGAIPRDQRPTGARLAEGDKRGRKLSPCSVVFRQLEPPNQQSLRTSIEDPNVSSETP